jgi:hypothetical protein
MARGSYGQAGRRASGEAARWPRGLECRARGQGGPWRRPAVRLELAGSGLSAVGGRNRQTGHAHRTSAPPQSLTMLAGWSVVKILIYA